MEDKCKCDCESFSYTLAFWVLRFWLATRAIFTGLVKFQGPKETLKPEYADMDKDMLEALGSQAYDVAPGLGINLYHGLPQKGPMSLESFEASPLMPSFMVFPYAAVLGYLLVLVGITTLLGICTRVSLFVQGMLYVSLTYGFVILEPKLGPDSAAGAAYLGVHVLIVAAALFLAKYNKIELLNDKKLIAFVGSKL